MKPKTSTVFEKLLFFAAIFLLGGVLGAFQIFPFNGVKSGFNSVESLYHEYTQQRSDLLRPLRYEGSGVVAIDTQAMQPGYTLIQGIMPGGTQIRMVDGRGREVHRWPIVFSAIWPDPDHVIPASRIPRTPFQYHTQGFWPLPDGSVVANIGDLGTVKLDRCGKAVWTVDRMTHHSVTATADGKFWIPAHIPLADTPDELLPAGRTREQIEHMLVGAGKNYHNSIIRIDGNGRVEQEFSVLRAIYDAGLEHAIYTSQRTSLADPTHVNDVEVVTAPLAVKISGVSAGDLLVSIREMQMLAILDQKDGRLKWYRQGPWFGQHDPDIMPDGSIELFNNRNNRISPRIQGSQILSFDPADNTTRVLYPLSAKDSFYAEILGTQQRLENDNLLIAESTQGRVFETTPAGKIVWDYRLPYDDGYSSLLEVAMRVPANYFDVETWDCRQTNESKP